MTHHQSSTRFRVRHKRSKIVHASCRYHKSTEGSILLSESATTEYKLPFWRIRPRDPSGRHARLPPASHPSWMSHPRQCSCGIPGDPPRTGSSFAKTISGRPPGRHAFPFVFSGLGLILIQTRPGKLVYLPGLTRWQTLH